MTLRNRNLSASNPSRPNGIFRATVTAVATDTISVKIPRLTGNIEYPDVSFYGDKPSVNDEIIVGFLEGNAGTPVALVLTGKASTLTSGSGGGGGSPGGSNTEIQFNNNGSFAGNNNLVYDGSSLVTMTKSAADTGIKVLVASDTEAHSGNIAFYKSEAGAGDLDKDSVYGRIDFYGNTASNGYQYSAAIKATVGEYNVLHGNNHTPSDIEFWATTSDQTTAVKRVVVKGGQTLTDSTAMEVHHLQADKGAKIDFMDSNESLLGYFGFNSTKNWYIKNQTTGNMFIECEGAISIRAEGNYEVKFSSTGLEPYTDEGYKLGSSSKEWSDLFVVDCAVSGTLTKSSGSFDIAHPAKGGDWRLRHSFIEGPTADNIYRGTVTIIEDSAVIDLDAVSGMTDGTWEALNTNPWTSVSSSGNAVTWSLSGKTLTINGPSGAVCNWMVIGERKDQAIVDSFMTDVDGRLITEYEKHEALES